MPNIKQTDKANFEREYKELYNTYLADKKILAFNFKILIAYEKWPPNRSVNDRGDVLKQESFQLSNEVKIIERQMKEYVEANYSILNLPT